MVDKEKTRPLVDQIRSVLNQMDKDDEFIISIPIGYSFASDDDRTEESEKTDRLEKANKGKESWNGREEI